MVQIRNCEINNSVITLHFIRLYMQLKKKTYAKNISTFPGNFNRRKKNCKINCKY